MSGSSRCLVYSLAVCLFLLFCAAGLVAQVTTAEIVGTVTDNSGAVVVGAQVTVKNLGTGATRSMVTNETGNYVFTFLPVGPYSVAVEAEGFKKFTAPSLTLAAGDRVRLDARMEVGDVRQSVEVQAEVAAALQTDSSTVGGLVTSKAVQDLPVNGRNFVKLVQLVAGANEGTTNSLAGGTRPDDRRQTSAISVNGQPELMNNFMIDGMDNNSRTIGTIGIKPSIDALEEVKVQTSLFTAEVGRVASAVINMITKSGTNTFHGTLFEFVRNDKFDAKDFFNVPQAGNPFAGVKPPYRQNQFGGSVGGPIRKNKLFFFGDYEGLRIVQGQTGNATVPTACELGRAECNGVKQIGNFSDMLPGRVIYDPMGSPTPFTNNVIPLSRINTVGANYAAMFPTSSSCSAANLTCQFVNNPVRTQFAHTFDVRGDMHLSEKNYFFTRYSFNNTDTLTPGLLPEVSVASVTLQPGGAPTGLSFPGPAKQRFHNAAIGYTRIFRPNLLLQLNASYLRATAASYPLNYGIDATSAFGQPGVNVSPQTSGLAALTFQDGGYVGLGDAAWIPLLNWDNTFQYSGAVTWIRGTHTIKFGASIIRRRADNYQSQYGKGNITVASQLTNSTAGGAGGSGGNSLASLLLGYPSQIQRTLSLVTQQYRMWENGVYMQDDWRLTSWLTLNVGLRWDVFTPFTEKNNNLSNFDPTDPALLATARVQVAGQNGVSDTVNIPTEYHDFQPRVGFAATVARGLVVRGGFASTYYPNNFASPSALKNAPFTSIYLDAAALGQPGTRKTTLGTSLPAAAPADTCLSPSCGASQITSVTGVSLKHKNSVIYQTNLTVEKEIAGNVVSVGYVGAFGRNQGRVLPNIDMPLPPLGPGGCGQTTAIILPSPCQPYYKQIPLISFIQLTTYEGIGNYNALQLNFQRRYKAGLTFAGNYTWAHGLSDVAAGPRGSCTACGLNLADPGYDYGNSDLDIRHRLAITANYELPFGKSLTGVAGHLVKGWQVNGIYLYSTGLPFTVVNSSSPQSNVGQGTVATATNVSGDRPNALPSSGFQQNLSQWFDTTAFTWQTWGTAGNEGRNPYYAPPQKRVDLSVFKDFPVKESIKLQFRVETFNLTNTPSFNLPASTISGWATNASGVRIPTQAGNFGRITTTSVFYTPRDIQFALKLVF